MTRYAIGVDVGGTNTKLVLVDDGGIIYLRDVIPTPRNAAMPEAFMTCLVDATLNFQRRAEREGFAAKGVGFAVPYYHEGVDWTSVLCSNMPIMEGFPMRPALCEAFGPSIELITDSSASGVAEYIFGKGRNFDRMLMMSIGTGISTSFITQQDGLVRYFWDTNGETGQIIVDSSGVSECSCGGRGCLEAVASATAIRRRAILDIQNGKSTSLKLVLQQKGDLEARDVSVAAEAGDKVALSIMTEAGFFLGVALTSYLHIFGPNLIVLGGGVAHAGDLLLEPIRRTMNKLASPWFLQRLKGIETTALGEYGAALGCASLILFPGKYLR